MEFSELLDAVLPFLQERQEISSAGQKTLPLVPHNPPLEVEGTSTFNHFKIDSRWVVPANTHLRDIVTAAKVEFYVAPSSEGVQAVTVFPQTMPLGGQSEAAGPPFMLGQEVGSGPAHPQLPSSSFHHHPGPSEEASHIGSLERSEVLGNAQIPPSPTCGGESLSDIYSRLVCLNYKGDNLTQLTSFHEQAQDIFDFKKKILFRMDELDPNGGWLVDGAPFLRNQKTGREYHLTRLENILKDLETRGLNSNNFQVLLCRKQSR